MFQPGQLQDYKALNTALDHLLAGEDDIISHLANASSLLNYFLDNVNWVGFYTMKNGQLQLGPFQGLPACVTIPLGRGVCGTAVSEDKVMRVADVHTFPGHIACDANSKSEIVIPVHVDGEVFGVLDIDAPIADRFTAEDEAGLLEFVSVLEQHLKTAA
ncbi:GAF domain-containing protein [Macrococcus equipercicus]|uniref:GAF domain-containing protein n=1 Tax=Macrococcus equipercicus TaxID=69967 RepID=A0A9Q9F0V6_9STAP|nr:GAF domain-containing protein [Macrococcus equipercicus]KAA1038433.1 GAF domain-containing protein [Macrococcus equipercicus]UTH13180.1 GAF domain-containing protein [Macrococcus equipercicus]